MLMQGWSVELTVVVGMEELDVVVVGAAVEVELTVVEVDEDLVDLDKTKRENG